MTFDQLKGYSAKKVRATIIAITGQLITISGYLQWGAVYDNGEIEDYFKIGKMIVTPEQIYSIDID
ncbi:MAG: hypothetical protein LUD19_01280 [Clostridia bacterium]|nr:hypothetical protein [Clostridia bacterium]